MSQGEPEFSSMHLTCIDAGERLHTEVRAAGLIEVRHAAPWMACAAC